MKSNFAIAALISFAAILTPAHASTVLSFATLGTGGATTAGNNLGRTFTVSGGTIKAFGWDNLPGTPTALPLDLVNNGGLNPSGLGVNKVAPRNVSQTTDIEQNQFIILDFSSVTAPVGQTLQSVTFTLYVDAPNANLNYEIYGITGDVKPGTLPTQLNPTGSASNLGTARQIVFNTTSLSTSYLIGVDCPINNLGGIDIQKVSLNYGVTPNTPTPEPGTFLMAGMALVGIGITVKKRRQKV